MIKFGWIMARTCIFSRMLSMPDSLMRLTFSEEANEYPFGLGLGTIILLFCLSGFQAPRANDLEQFLHSNLTLTSLFYPHLVFQSYYYSDSVFFLWHDDDELTIDYASLSFQFFNSFQNDLKH